MFSFSGCEWRRRTNAMVAAADGVRVLRIGVDRTIGMTKQLPRSELFAKKQGRSQSCSPRRSLRSSSPERAPGMKLRNDAVPLDLVMPFFGHGAVSSVELSRTLEHSKTTNSVPFRSQMMDL